LGKDLLALIGRGIFGEMEKFLQPFPTFCGQ
jgi:hypothetical protein